MRLQHRLSVRKKLAYSLLALVTVCGLPEIALRLLGFEHATSLERMSFTFPVDEFNRSSDEPFLQRHETLFWQPIPGVLGHNSRGFFGPEFSDTRPAGTVRIVCLGDSCTHFGPDPYPTRLQRQLDVHSLPSADVQGAADMPRSYEVINASCLGYTSWQGRVLMDASVKNWSPDVVTVYFGWNDHWLSRGVPDHQQLVGSRGLQSLTERLGKLRVYQLMHRALTTPNNRTHLPLRVPLEQYAANLKHICHKCREIGAECWLITAPHALDILIPEYLVSAGEVERLSDVMPLHVSYNDIVRREAQTLQCRCIDAERIFDGMDKRDLFLPDAIHLSDQGRSLMADLLFHALTERDNLQLTGSANSLSQPMQRTPESEQNGGSSEMSSSNLLR